MKYIYDVFSNGVRYSTTTDFSTAEDDFKMVVKPEIRVFEGMKNNNTAAYNLKTEEDVEGWRYKLERDKAWRGPSTVNNNHKWDPMKDLKWDPMKDLLDDHIAKKNLENSDISRNIQSAVSPKHYMNYIEEFQWLDVMRRIPTLRDKEKFSAACEMQVRKYLDRNGQKDNSIQELKKARFYLEYWIQFLEGKEPAAEKVHAKLVD